ncbi:hypothetical protein Sru01_33500 [Sphaerisporangium rufum]|uniref:Uncharacterized protein n=1 Tax=Sphaerisporangium rufum TaxID=1381558 RepID=A0A919R3H2_9ACTN|nr:hypothetical protein Sru01_33500 [Sphaerisporangium rufum]
MVEPQPAGPAVPGEPGRDVDEQAFLFVWREPHGRTLGNRRFRQVTVPFPRCDLDRRPPAVPGRRAGRTGPGQAGPGGRTERVVTVNPP